MRGRDVMGYILAAALVGAAAPAAVAQGPSRDVTIAPAGPVDVRLALVIGNSAYRSAPLRNPVNDAREMVRVLRQLGFEVIEHTDASEKDMRRAMREFSRRLKPGGVGLFYYAGHGIQVLGKNYLVPVDAEIHSEAEVEVEAVDAAKVLAGMETAQTRLNIVILDACRNNPFGRSFRSAAQGLASIDAPSGTLLAYATAPGKVAADGEGSHGLYTEELLKAMQEPGLTIEQVFKRVRQGVQRQTGGSQVPWESSSLTGEFMFSVPPAGAQGRAGAPSPGVPGPAPRGWGSLLIGSKVPGVEVWVGENRVGETQADKGILVENLNAGTYRVRGRKGAGPDWERDVEVAPGQRVEVMIDPQQTGDPRVALVPLPQDPKETLRLILDGLRQHGLNLSVDVSPDGVATLTGLVESPEWKQKAKGIALGVAGVREVQDRIFVAPPSGPRKIR